MCALKTRVHLFLPNTYQTPCYEWTLNYNWAFFHFIKKDIQFNGSSCQRLTLGYMASCFLLTCREERLWLVSQHEQNMAKPGWPSKGAASHSSRWIVPELRSLLRWGWMRDKDEGSNSWAGQVHWKWWNKVGMRLPPYSPQGASVPEKRQRQQDHERQKKVWSRRQKKNNSFLAQFAVKQGSCDICVLS